MWGIYRTGSSYIVELELVHFWVCFLRVSLSTKCRDTLTGVRKDVAISGAVAGDAAHGAGARTAWPIRPLRRDAVIGARHVAHLDVCRPRIIAQSRRHHALTARGDKLPLIRPWLQQRFDSTNIRPRYDHGTTYITNGLLHCGVNKKKINGSAWLRLASYVTLTLMTFDEQSNGRRTAVESKSNRSCNQRITSA